MTAHEIHALSGAYAVDALDDLERARFEAHLSACAECQAEVASLSDAAALFPALTESAPPAALRTKVLADIKTVRPLPPTVARLETRRPRRFGNLVAAAAVLGVL
ncbi:MAG: zf-HC2 domain-containing protein, partial [Marmoricola sp.]